MEDKSRLLPPLPVVLDRLSRNQRERRRLRTLVKLIRESDEPSGEPPTRVQPEPPKKGGAA
jgi:hypothetical protein